ncbi:hypothetical protein [Kingella kingae]|uniref:hypothetical protein n=1 Tax=Kingella kingae TaxID=504 RepID=UPI0003FC1D8E|nr:hypothetical protein [Kingella kingae]
MKKSFSFVGLAVLALSLTAPAMAEMLQKFVQRKRQHKSVYEASPTRRAIRLEKFKPPW